MTKYISDILSIVGRRMNFLAHFYFAHPTPEAFAGQVMGDFVKGTVPADLPPVVIDNIRLHRHIDGLTDRHPDVLAAKSLFKPPWRRYAGIVLDIYFDHLLSVHWQSFSDVSRRHYIHESYRLLNRYRGPMPAHVRRIVALMIEQDWLSEYHSREGLTQTLGRVGRRLRRPVPLHAALDELNSEAETLESLFLHFFPDLIDRVAATR